MYGVDEAYAFGVAAAVKGIYQQSDLAERHASDGGFILRHYAERRFCHTGPDHVAGFFVGDDVRAPAGMDGKSPVAGHLRYLVGMDSGGVDDDLGIDDSPVCGHAYDLAALNFH